MIISRLHAIKSSSLANSNEYLLASYFLDNARLIETIQIKDIICATNVSKSTVQRFIKKIGYETFGEVQYLISTKSHESAGIEIDKSIVEQYPVFEQKERIIVVGDNFSIAPLFPYGAHFEAANVELELCFSLLPYNKMISGFELSDKDLVILVSLFKNEVELVAELFNGYVEFERHIKKTKQPYLFIGKSPYGSKARKDKWYLDQKGDLSEMIFELCKLFEKICSYYS